MTLGMPFPWSYHDGQTLIMWPFLDDKCWRHFLMKSIHVFVLSRHSPPPEYHFFKIRNLLSDFSQLCFGANVVPCASFRYKKKTKNDPCYASNAIKVFPNIGHIFQNKIREQVYAINPSVNFLPLRFKTLSI